VFEAYTQKECTRKEDEGSRHLLSSPLAKGGRNLSGVCVFVSRFDQSILLVF